MKKRTHEDLIGNPEACQRELIRGLTQLYINLTRAFPGVWKSPTLKDLLSVIEALEEHFQKESYPHISVWWQPPLQGIDYKDTPYDELDDW